MIVWKPKAELELRIRTLWRHKSVYTVEDKAYVEDKQGLQRVQ